MVSVDICAATRARPLLLKTLLESLGRIKVSEGVSARIVIVDNDGRPSAQPVVETFAESSSLPVVYEHEQRQGIAFARNRCLSLVRAEWMAFVDDDEFVSEGWLQALLDAAEQWKADVVFGPVLPSLPADAPKWVVRGGFFARRRYPSGTVIKGRGATNNVLISRALLERAGRGFSLEFNLTGGSDTEFFHYLSKIGARMVFCNDALVTEIVPSKRASLRWLMRRHFRGGQGTARIFVPDMAYWQRPIWLVQRLSYLLVAAVGTVILLPAGLHWSIKALTKVASNCGQISAPFGRWFEEYK